MKTIHFSDDYELSVQGSPWALILYQREFADNNGVPADFYADWDNYVKGIFEFDEDGEPVEVKKNQTIDIFFLLKIAWAMASCVDTTLPDFEQWAREAPIPMSKSAKWMLEVQTAVMAEIFRNEPPEKEKTDRKGTAGRRTNRRKADSGS